MRRIANEDIYPHVEKMCKDIALNRRLIEITIGEAEEFDNNVNEWCKKYHDKFKDMNFGDIMTYMLTEIIQGQVEEAKNGR